MRIRISNLFVLVLVAVLAGSAFVAGARLRDWHNSSGAQDVVNVQATALLKITPECAPVTPPKAGQSISEQRDFIGSVVKHLKAYYVDPITPEREASMARGAAQGMIDSLMDPDSRFLDPKERRLLDEAGSGRFSGIGAVLALRKRKADALDVTDIVVVAPMPGSPAEEAGLRPGDSIIDLGGKWIITRDPFEEAGLPKLMVSARNKLIDDLTVQKVFEAADKKLREGVTISDTLQALTTKSSGDLILKVERPGESQPIQMKVRCRDTRVDPVVSQILKRRIAYIRISQFSSGAAKEFAAELEKARANRVKALLLDLRNTPGGSLDSAAEITSKITGGGVTAIIQSKNRKAAIRLPKTRGLDMPIAILVNGGTASVAELVSATLRESGLATLVGAKTFGDGLVQTPLMLKDGSAAVLTTGKMLTPKGFDFNEKGVEPDKVVEKGPRGDAQLEEAERLLLAKLGRV